MGWGRDLFPYVVELQLFFSPLLLGGGGGGGGGGLVGSGRVGEKRGLLLIYVYFLRGEEGRKEGKKRERWFDYLFLLCLWDGGRENRCCVLFCVDLAWKKI